MTLGPERARGGDALTCDVTTSSTDADGDAFAYAFAWELDGVPFDGATDGAERSEVPATATATGQVWTCRVAVSDTLGGESDAAAELTLE